MGKKTISLKYIKSITNKREGYLAFSLWFVFFSIATCHAQVSLRKVMDQYSFSSITIKDGLPHNFIDDIYKDSQGFLWLSTHNGLSRYDGSNFVNYNINSKVVRLRTNFIKQVCEDNYYRLWIASEAGLDALNLKTNHLEKINYSVFKSENLSKEPVYFILKDKQGSIWLATQTNLYKLTFTNNGHAMFCHSLFSTYDRHAHSITSLKMIGEEIWIGYGQDVYKAYTFHNRLRLQRVFQHSLFEAKTSIYCYCSLDSNIWIGTNKGLYRYNKLTHLYKHYLYNENNSHSLNQSYISDLAVSHNHELVVATQKGLNFYDPAIDGFVRMEQSWQTSKRIINCNFVNCLYSDGAVMWIGTEIGGLDKMSSRSLKTQIFTYNIKDNMSLSDNPVNSIFEDSEGDLWTGNVEQGLSLKRKKTDSFIHIRHEANNINSLSHNSVTAIGQDDQKQLWIGTWGGGLNCMNLSCKLHPSFIRYNTGNSTLKNDFIGSVAFDALNSGIWVGTTEGLSFFDLKKHVFINLNLPTDRIPDNSMTGMLIDRNNRLWIGTHHGLLIIDLFSFAKNRKNISYHYEEYKLDTPQSQLIEKIDCIFQASDGTIWLGSDGYGLYRLVSDKTYPYTFKSYTINNGLPDNTIFGIEEDKSGNLWLSTNYGLSCFNIRTKNFINYFEGDGLPFEQFYLNAYCKSKDGTLYFGGVNGMIGIKGINKISTKKETRVLFTKLSVSNETIDQGENKYTNQSISWATNLHLHEHDKSFSLEFSTLDFENADKLKYRYRLKGFDDKWIECDPRHHYASYTNLKSGHYILQVQAYNTMTAMDSPITELSIKVSPYFYKTWWFYSIIFIFIMIGVFYFFQWKIATYKEQRRVLTAKVKERTLALEEKMEVLSQQNDLLTKQKKQLIELSKKIQEITADKISFFTNITHEFRTPITLIMGPIDKALKLSKSPMVVEQLNIVERNSKSLLSLVNQLLDFRKVESGRIAISKKSNDLLSLIKNVTLPFEAFAKERHIQVKSFVHIKYYNYFYDEDWMRKVFTNLLSNAIKFTPDGGKIKFYVFSYLGKNKRGQLYICISDTGVGIPSTDLVKIFNRFYQSHNQVKFPMYGQSGTGIGLYLCRRIIQEHGGHIYAVNNHLKGSSVRILMNIEPDISQGLLDSAPHYEITTPKSSVPFVEEKTEDRTINKERTILIVDDNMDMRTYVRSILCPKYNIVDAGDGIEALEILQTKNIDFIISDLMMPRMDGMELSKKIKEDIKISHIPILILTAKDSEESRIESFRIGVDEYLQKPFNEELLLLRIHRIFDSKINSQHQFEMKMDPQTLNIDEESRDSKFLKEIMQVMKEHYTDAEFDVTKFAEIMNVSKTLMNQKLQNVIGQSTAKFIANYRLKKAWEFIQINKISKNMNVSDIAYEVGFNDPKYFTRCFQKKYKMLPSSLIKSENPDKNH